MKQLSKPTVLSSVCVGAGLLCLCLRQWLLTSGVDHKGLLLESHPGSILSWILTALVAAVLILSLLGKGSYRFAHTPLSATGDLFQAVAYLAASAFLFSRHSHTLSLAAAITGIVCALCSVLHAVGQFQGKRVHTIFYCPSVVFYMLFLLAQYQTWSRNPQPQRYFFPMLASVCLMLGTYYRAAKAASNRHGRDYLLLSRGSIFLCLSAIPDPGLSVFFGAMGVSVLLDGCVLKSQPAGE